jgi:hypothetical protein
MMLSRETCGEMGAGARVEQKRLEEAEKERLEEWVDPFVGPLHERVERGMCQAAQLTHFRILGCHQQRVHSGMGLDEAF